MLFIVGSEWWMEFSIFALLKNELNALIDIITPIQMGHHMTEYLIKWHKTPVGVESSLPCHFAAVPRTYLEAIRSQPTALENVVKYHIAKGKLTSDSFISQQSVKTESSISADIKVTVYRKVGDLTVLKTKYRASISEGKFLVSLWINIGMFDCSCGLSQV